MLSIPLGKNSIISLSILINPIVYKVWSFSDVREIFESEKVAILFGALD